MYKIDVVFPLLTLKCMCVCIYNKEHFRLYVLELYCLLEITPKIINT